MRLSKTRAALAYWMDLFQQAGNAPVNAGDPVWPERSAIQPSQCATIMGDLFILDLTDTEPSYRLAGTQLCNLFGQELRDQPFAGLYREADRNVVAGWADQLSNEQTLVLLCSRAANRSGETVVLETLLMPLANNGRQNERVLGVTVPVATPYWVGAEPVSEVTLLTVRSQAPWRDQTPARGGLSHMQGPLTDHTLPPMRRVRHLGVLEGGLSTN